MDAFNLVDILTEVGPYCAILLFFIWRDYRREDRLEDRIDKLNEFVRGELMVALKRNNDVLDSWLKP